MKLKFLAALPLILALTACGEKSHSNPTAIATTTAQPAAVAAPSDPNEKKFSCRYDTNDRRLMVIVMNQFSPSPDGSSDEGSYTLHGGAYDGESGSVNLNGTIYNFNDGQMLAHGAEIDTHADGSVGLVFDGIAYMCTVA